MRQLCFRSLSQILSNDQNPNLEPIASWVPTASDLSIDYISKTGFMVTGNENTIKLIYAIQDIITLMILLNIYGKWSIGHNSTFRGSHPEDSGEVRGNGNAPCVLEDDGNL